MKSTFGDADPAGMEGEQRFVTQEGCGTTDVPAANVLVWLGHTIKYIMHIFVAILLPLTGEGTSESICICVRGRFTITQS